MKLWGAPLWISTTKRSNNQLHDRQMSSAYTSGRLLNSLDLKEECFMGFNTSTPLNRIVPGKDKLVDDSPIHISDSHLASEDEARRSNSHFSHIPGSSYATDIGSPASLAKSSERYCSELQSVFQAGEVPGSIKLEPPSLGRSLNWDPRTPYVLLLYLQLALNVVLVALLAYLSYLVISTLRADINQKVEMWISDALSEISACSREYYRNKCHNDEHNTRAPALDQTCNSWKKCMNRDPQQLAKSMVTAETLADVLNAFVHRLSWKSLAVLFSLVLCSLFASQLLFGRHKEWVDSTIEQKERMSQLEDQLLQLKCSQGQHQKPLPFEIQSHLDDSSVASMNSPLSKYARPKR